MPHPHTTVRDMTSKHMVESSIGPAKFTKDEFRRRFCAGLIAAWLIPPATGELGMTFLGFWELGEAGLSLIRFTGAYIIGFTLIAFVVFKRQVIEPVMALSEHQPTLNPAHIKRLKAFPWVFWGLLSLYCSFGPPSVLLSNAVFDGKGYTLGQYAFSAFGVIPFLLVAAFPLFFYLTDLLGRFLAPRGIVVMVAPLWLKVTVLGLFTPVMIDTILLTYYFNRTGFLTAETLVLWLLLILGAGLGTRLALRSFHQGMFALKKPLGGGYEVGIHAYPVPSSLDEFGLLARGWADLLEAHDRAELEVRERDRRIRDILDNTEAVIHIKDKDGRYLLINRRYEQLFGVSHADAVDKTDHDLFPHEVADAFRQNDLKVIREEAALEFQEIVPHVDGLHTYISQKFPLYDADRVLYGVCGVSTDITERKRVEAERARYAARLQGLAEASLVVSSTLSLDEVLKIVTEKAREVIGAHQSVTSMTVDENWAQAINTVSLSDKYAAYQEYDEKPDGSGIYRLVCQMNRPMRMTQAELEAHPAWRGFGKEAGKHPPMRGWLAAPLTGHDGRNIGLIQLSDKYEGEFTDDDEAILVQLAQMGSVAVENARLFEQVSVERGRLRESDAQVRLLLESTAEGIYGLDLDGNCTFANSACVRMLGYDNQDELLGKNMHTLIHHTRPDGSPYPVEDSRIYQAFRENKGSHVHDEVMSRSDGSSFVAEYWSYPTRRDGQTVGTVVTFFDITERQRIAEELRRHREHLEELVKERTAELAVAKERAEAADRLKSAFLATMSHELRTPLNSMIGFTGIMLQGLAGPLSEEQTKQLGMVRNSAHHLLHLINEVLDLSKIEAGQLEIVSEPIEVREAIEKVAGMVTLQAENKGLTLLRRVAPEVGWIISDRRRVEQILLNLLNNAIKFTAKGEVCVECQVRDGWVVTSVVDTGIGIKPEDMGTLFEPFGQIDTGLARRHEGTGLGLAICKRLVTLLGGEIWVESEWGVGSTFTFTLPVGM